MIEPGRELARWLLEPKPYIPAVSRELPRKIRGFRVMRYVPQLLMSAAMIAGRIDYQASVLRSAQQNTLSAHRKLMLLIPRMPQLVRFTADWNPDARRVAGRGFGTETALDPDDTTGEPPCGSAQQSSDNLRTDVFQTRTMTWGE